MKCPSRRALLLGGASLVLASAITGNTLAATTPIWHWRKYGGDPFVKKDGRSEADREAEAMRRLPEALEKLGIAASLRSRFVELVKSKPKGMRSIELRNGKRLTAMMSGSRVQRNVQVAFDDVIKGQISASAYAREWYLDGTTLVLPEICFNWAFYREDCFAIRIDGRNHPVKRPLQTVVSFYGISDHLKLAVDECFYAIDGRTGERLNLVRECLVCVPDEVETVWPADVAIHTKTEATFTVVQKNGTIGFPSGYGTLFIPHWAASSIRFCFVALERYEGAGPSWGAQGTWTYSSYFHMIVRSELEADLHSRPEFRRVVIPNGVLGRRQ